MAGSVASPGHNSDGKFIARAQRIEYDCELVPRRVAIFIEKTKDGQILPVPNVVVRDVACGANHTVRLGFLPCGWRMMHQCSSSCSSRTDRCGQGPVALPAGDVALWLQKRGRGDQCFGGAVADGSLQGRERAGPNWTLTVLRSVLCPARRRLVQRLSTSPPLCL